MFKLGDDLKLDASEAFSSTYAAIGIRGSGKSYLMMKFGEQALDNGYQCLFLDPQGICHGLRAKPDGKQGYPLLLLGGPHGADVPLQVHHGTKTAEALVTTGASMILDLSDFKKAESRTFMTAFLLELFRRKNTAKTPLMVFLDEAHLWAPQTVSGSDASVVGALEDITGRGRSRGLFMFLTTQRAAKINKNVLSQCETLFVMRQIAPHDKKAIRDWLTDAVPEAQIKAAMESLASLPQGEAWLFSPGSMGEFKQFRVGRRTTLDTSSTPKAGTAAAKALKSVALPAELVESVAKLLDPPKPVKTVPQPPPSPAQKHKELTEKIIYQHPLTPEETARLKELQQRSKELSEALARTAKEMAPLIDKLSKQIIKAGAEIARVVAKTKDNVKITVSKPPAVHHQVDTRISGPQQTLINVLAEAQTALGLPGLDKSKLAAWADVSPKSSGLRANLSTLKGLGLIGYGQGGLIFATESGLAAAQPVETPMTLASYREAWAKRLSAPQRAMIDKLLAAGRDWPLLKEYLAESTGQSITSSGFRANLSTLRSHGLIDYDNGAIKLTAMLFPEGVE